MRVFFDSTALVKRYVREDGTDIVLSWCDQTTEFCLSGIAIAEIISAFCRLLRERQISPLQYRHLKAMLMADILDATICDITPEVVRQTILSLENNVLCGMDAIHLGSALALHTELFISADSRQCAAAANAGLKVIQV